MIVLTYSDTFPTYDTEKKLRLNNLNVAEDYIS